MLIKKCLQCGCNDFDINEFIVHRAYLCGEEGDLTYYKNKNHGIESIICIKCKSEYSEKNFKQINF